MTRGGVCGMMSSVRSLRSKSTSKLATGAFGELKRHKSVTDTTDAAIPKLVFMRHVVLGIDLLCHHQVLPLKINQRQPLCSNLAKKTNYHVCAPVGESKSTSRSKLATGASTTAASTSGASVSAPKTSLRSKSTSKLARTGVGVRNVLSSTNFLSYYTAIKFSSLLLLSAFLILDDVVLPSYTQFLEGVAYVHFFTWADTTGFLTSSIPFEIWQKALPSFGSLQCAPSCSSSSYD